MIFFLNRNGEGSPFPISHLNIFLYFPEMTEGNIYTEVNILLTEGRKCRQELPTGNMSLLSMYFHKILKP